MEGNLGKAARVSALFALTQQVAASAIGRELTVDLEIVRRDGTQEVFDLYDFPTPSSGDVIKFFVTNTSDLVVDLTVLFIDSSFGIEPWFPYLGESNRISPGETLKSELEVKLSTDGVQRFLFVAAAVQPGAPRAGFSFLAQAGMASRSVGLAGMGDTTLAEILADAGVDIAPTRSSGRPGASLASMSSFSWVVSPNRSWLVHWRLRSIPSGPCSMQRNTNGKATDLWRAVGHVAR